MTSTVPRLVWITRVSLTVQVYEEGVQRTSAQVLTVLSGGSGDPGGNRGNFLIAGWCFLPERSVGVGTGHIGGQDAYVDQLIVGFAAAQDVPVNAASLRSSVREFLENDPPVVPGLVPKEVAARWAVCSTVHAAATVTLHCLWRCSEPEPGGSVLSIPGHRLALPAQVNEWGESWPDPQ
jgi:hypothetical protein